MTERINEKLLANTPKGGKLGGDGILRHNGKEYVAHSMDITGNKVIYQQLGKNNKPVEIYKITNDKGYLVIASKPKLSASQSSPSTLIKDATKDIKFYDSSKPPGIVAGGIISAGIDTYSQYTKNNNSFNNYDPLSAIMNITVGLYTGGASYMLSAVTRGASGNMASEIYSQATDLSKDIDGERILLKTAIGGFTGFVTSGSGKLDEKIPRGRDGSYKTILENTAGAAMGFMQAEVDNKQ